jgi:hypothetical protein
MALGIDGYQLRLDQAFGHNDSSWPLIVVRLLPSFLPEAEIQVRNGPAGHEVTYVELDPQLWSVQHKQFEGKQLTDHDFSGVRQRVTPLKVEQASLRSIVGVLPVVEPIPPPKCRTDRVGKGCWVIMDGTSYLVIVDGQRRAKVKDTSRSNLLNEQQQLLEWIVKAKQFVCEHWPDPTTPPSLGCRAFDVQPALTRKRQIR